MMLVYVSSVAFLQLIIFHSVEVLPETATWDAEEGLSLMKRTRQVWVEKSKDFENKWKNLDHHLEIETILLAAVWICSIVERR